MNRMNRMNHRLRPIALLSLAWPMVLALGCNRMADIDGREGFSSYGPDDAPA